ncbi:MAG: type I-C CRISPR-associated protein Cas8c/Csd1 [Nitrospinae bacterium]|nr:type I-C CRISPR-associated protein Cas8c/Csd1 [Nitrospinota bacterium]
MILQALKEYYDRKASDSDGALAPEGFEVKEIPFVIVIDSMGRLVQIEDTRSGDGKKKRAKSFLVPLGEKKSVNVAANLLWGNAEYVLKIPDAKKLEDRKRKGKEDDYLARLEEMHKAFVDKIKSQAPVDDIGVLSVLKFCESIPLGQLEGHAENWNEIRSSNPNVTFRLNAESDLVCQRPSVIQALQRKVKPTASPPPSTEERETHISMTPPPGTEDEETARGVCLVSGELSEIERLHPSIKGVWGAQPSGANIVSFNQRSFESYGKEGRQGDNAPTSKAATFAYTTALNALLGRDSKQRLQVGDASTLFWAERPDEMETAFPDLFGEPPQDDPDCNTRAVESLYRSVQSGAFSTDSANTRFYVLGLAPNASRISIRFWHGGTVAEMAGRFRQYFDELKIVHGPKESPYLSLFRLLVNTASLGKADNIPPNLAGDVMRAILAGSPYPATLLQAAIRRIRAEQALKDKNSGKPIPNVNYPRAALIKACINRNSGKEELTVSLDESNTNQAYRLGRLFAVLEKAQEEANPKINATIRDRYYSSASAAPSTAFPILMRLKNHHVSKLENRGRAVNLERLIGSITDGISSDGFPSHLSLQDQGRFAIGYYHQRQDFFKGKNTGDNAE